MKRLDSANEVGRACKIRRSVVNQRSVRRKVVSGKVGSRVPVKSCLQAWQWCRFQRGKVHRRCTTGRCITARPVRSRFAVSRYADPWLLSSYVGSSGVAVDVSSIGCRLVRSVMCKEGGGVVHGRL